MSGLATFIVIALMKLLRHLSERAYDILLLLLYVPHILFLRFISKTGIIITVSTSGTTDTKCIRFGDRILPMYLPRWKLYYKLEKPKLYDLVKLEILELTSRLSDEPQSVSIF